MRPTHWDRFFSFLFCLSPAPMFSSDRSGFVADDQYASKFLPFISLSTLDHVIHYHRHESILMHENNSFNGLNQQVSHQLLLAHDHVCNEPFTALYQAAATVLPHSSQYGSRVIVQRSVMEMVTYQQIFQPQPPPPPLPLLPAPSSNHYQVPHSQTLSPASRYSKILELEDHDTKPNNFLRFPALPIPIQDQEQIPGDSHVKDCKKQGDELGTRSLKHKKYGPYTCPRCNMEIQTSQSFASHMKSHYSSETLQEKKKRMGAKYKKKNLRVAFSEDGFTLVPGK